jgi:pyruvate kinase
LSRQRNYVRTIGVSESHDTLRQMTLLWGVQPLAKAPTADGGELLRFAEARGRAQGGIRSGDYIVLIAGTDALAQSKHNMIQVYQLP